MAASGNNTTTTACPANYSDLSEFLTRSLDNATALVAACPDACDIAWGRGNPDLSGIGACISYIIQACLTILFQFPFIVLYRFSPSARRRTLARLYESYFKVYAAVNVSVLVASSVLRANPDRMAGYELAFMLYLLQFMAVGACVATSTPLIVKLLEALVVGVDKDQFRWRLTVKKALLVLVVFAVNFAAAAYQLFTDDDVDEFEAIYALAGPLCPAYESIEFPSDTTLWVWLVASLLMSLSLLPVLWIHRRARRGQPVMPRAVAAWLVGLILVGVVLCGLLGFLVSRIDGVRSDVRNLHDTPDDNWSFGQVLSLFVWVDPLVSIGSQGVKMVHRRFSRRMLAEQREQPEHGPAMSAARLL